VLNCVFLITKIEILFYICLSLAYSLVINKNNFFLKIESINVVKNSISLYIVENSISLIASKNSVFFNIAKNSIFFKIAKTLISLNSFTISNRSILVKTTFILTNFLFDLLTSSIN